MSGRHRGPRSLVWAAGLIVAVGAGAATAHGLYEVATAAGVPPPIAWLYPLITDGLALVAYATAARLLGSGRGHAWAVVVLAAGLSGLAQASYLAGAVRAAPAALRFGVGAWPAIAAAIVAHLLYLLGHTSGSTDAPGAPASGSRSRAAPTGTPVPSSAGNPAPVPRTASPPDARTASPVASKAPVPAAANGLPPVRRTAAESAARTTFPAKVPDTPPPGPAGDAAADRRAISAPGAGRPGAPRAVRTDDELLAALAGRIGPISVRAAARELGCGVDRARRLLTAAGLRPNHAEPSQLPPDQLAQSSPEQGEE